MKWVRVCHDSHRDLAGSKIFFCEFLGHRPDNPLKKQALRTKKTEFYLNWFTQTVNAQHENCA